MVQGPLVPSPFMVLVVLALWGNTLLVGTIMKKYQIIYADPPYSTDLSGKIYHTGTIREKMYQGEAVRVCKVGGHVGLYHWVMSPRPEGTRYDRIIVVIGRVRHHARFCCVFQKVRSLFDWGNEADCDKEVKT